MSDWLYHPDNSPPLSSTVGYYSPWRPGGLLLTRQSRRSSSILSFRCQNYVSRTPWNWQCSPTRTLQISDWGASSSVPSQGTQWKQWRCTLVHSFRPNHCHLVLKTNAKSGRLMNWSPHHWRRLPNRSMTSCPLKWINWSPGLLNQLLV